MSKHYSIAAVICFIFHFSAAKAQVWKTYPYHQPGAVLTFPNDEGYHPGQVVEWWYTNAHVTGSVTGKKYSYMISYFYYPTLGVDGFRIFNVADETTGQFLKHTDPVNYPTLAQDHLELNASPLLGGQQEEWVTKRDSVGNLVPFEYHLLLGSSNTGLDVNYVSLKRPLMVGGTGFLYEGATAYTYYYSETSVDVTGSLTVNGYTEPITGTAWIDRQWGQFNPNNMEQYEWFSFQLSNGMDMNVWNLFNFQNQIPDTSTYRFCSYHLNDSTDMTTSSFGLERLKYAYMPDNARCYSQKWHYIYNDIDLIIETLHGTNEVTLPFRFYEGSCTITGTVGGVPVTGIGFAELLHSYVNPSIAFVSPDTSNNWNSSMPVKWTLLNPEGGKRVYYDLAYSLDNKATYTNIASSITDTFFLWNASVVTPGTACWLKVTGFSVDTTLIGSKELTSPIGMGIAETHIGSAFSTAVFPNPFVSETAISFDLKNASDVKASIYDQSGKKVKELQKGFISSGKHTLSWNGNNDEGMKVSAGVYFFRIESGTEQEEKRVVFIK